MTRLPASHTNWPCVILAVDPGASTGAAIVVSRPGLFHVSQVEHVPAGMEGDWLADACEIAIANRLPLIVDGAPQLVDGWHRLAAMVKAGLSWVTCERALAIVQEACA